MEYLICKLMLPLPPQRTKGDRGSDATFLAWNNKIPIFKLNYLGDHNWNPFQAIPALDNLITTITISRKRYIDNCQLHRACFPPSFLIGSRCLYIYGPNLIYLRMPRDITIEAGEITCFEGLSAYLVAYSPDGRYILGGGKEICLWDDFRLRTFAPAHNRIL